MAVSPEGYEKAVWQSCGPPRSVVVVEVNGYTIGPEAELSGANLSGAKATADTVWPEGFDPVATGLIFE